ncbi:MAG: SusC/RagA family TonB-linked outer membrane protein, partial [Bacteroidota bacterium]
AQAPISPSLPNDNIGWETVESTDFGVDVSLFNNKVTFLATYYNRKTKDFLYGLPIPYTSGYGGTDVNVGSVKNSGFEFDLSYNTKIANKINLNVSGNLTTVKNRLVALAPGVEEYSSGDYRTAIGFPIGYFYGYKATGIYQNATQAGAALPDDVAGTSNLPRPGDVIFQDNNSPLAGTPNGKQFTGTPDGRITPADRTYLGKTIPDFFYGLNIDAAYKGFDVAVLFQGVSGIQVYNSLRQSMEGLGGPGRNELASTKNRWTGEGTSNSMPRAIDGDPYNNNRFSSRFVENAGFFRLKNLQIGYSLPQSLLEKTKAFHSARIYIGATNLFVITKYTGLDPEVVTFGNVSSQTNAGTDQGSTPQPRTYQAGIQFNF